MTIIFKWLLYNTYKNVERSLIESVLFLAFSNWEKYIDVSFQKINVSELNFYDNKIIRLGFHSKHDTMCFSDFDGKNGILAHATYPSSAKNSNLFIHFDSDEDWDFDVEIDFANLFSSKPKFYNIALHEIGHVLGLPHNENLNSIMNKKYSKLIFKPSSEDVKELQKILDKKQNDEEIEDDNLLLTYIKVYYIEFVIFIFLVIFLLFIFKYKNVLRNK